MSWHEALSGESESLTEPRLQLHYGAYLLASTAHSILEHATDDSHSNLGFDPGRVSLVTRDLGLGLALHLDLEPLELVLRRSGTALDALALEGRSVDQALAWIEQSLGAAGVEATVQRREYPDFPASPLMGGGLFSAEGADERSILGAWLECALELLEGLRAKEPRMSALRVWPHHFDLGALILLAADGSRSIGLGFSPGDEQLVQPYFYCSPYPAPASGTALPTLPVGHWTTEGFTSAILAADELGDADEPGGAATRYLAASVAQCHALVGDST